MQDNPTHLVNVVCIVAFGLFTMLILYFIGTGIRRLLGKGLEKGTRVVEQAASKRWERKIQGLFPKTSLLRSSDVPPPSADTLLRGVTATEEGKAEELLRASE